MAFWNEPIEVSNLWRGPTTIRSPYATVSLTLLARLVVIVGIATFTLFILAALAMMVMITIKDPWMAAGCFAVVIAPIFVIRLLYRRPKPGEPPSPTEGTGIPVPTTPVPVSRVGADAKELYPRRRRTW